MTTHTNHEPQANAYPNVAAGFLLQQAEDEARESTRWPFTQIDLDAGRFLHVIYFPARRSFYGFSAETWEYSVFEPEICDNGKHWCKLSRDEAIDVLARCIEHGDCGPLCPEHGDVRDTSVMG